MAWFGPKDKERERYYLFAGMGGKRAVRQKRLVMLQWAFGAGIVVSAILAAILYLMHAYSR